MHPSSCLPADLDPPASATHPSACLGPSTLVFPSAWCLSLCPSHTHTHTPGALLCKSHSDNQNDEVGLVLFGLQRQPRFSQFSAIHRLCLSDHPTPAAPSSLDPKAFYLSNLLRATCLLPKSSKWSPRKSLDKSVEMCVQGCPLQNCL